MSTHSACGWAASTGVEWITLTPTSGKGPASVQLTFAANPGPPRSATVTIAGQALAFTQDARAAEPPPPPPPDPPAPPPPPAPPQCSFEVRPDVRDFTPAGGIGSFSVVTGAGCPWTASSGASWVAITGEPSGTGEAEVRYFVEPNATTTSREATIVVAGATHRVRQSGLSGDGDDDDDDDGVRIRGVVSALTGTCPALRFVVEGQTVTTTSQTDFRRGNCSHMANGLEVLVEGTRQSNGEIAARSVTLFRE